MARLGAFEHPKVNAVFVRFVLRVGRGDTLREEDVVLRLPKARVRGIKLARKGERLRLQGKLSEAIEALERSIELAPEYLPSRVSLIRAYAKAGRKEAALLRRLKQPIAEQHGLIGPRPDGALLTKLLSSWPNANIPESFPWHEPRANRDGIALYLDW